MVLTPYQVSAMNKQKIIHDYVLRGLNCLPQPIVDSEVKRLVNEYLKGKYGNLTLEEVWKERLKKHEQYWHSRFALNLGYKLLDNKPRIYGNWNDYSIFVKIGGHSPLIITYHKKITTDMLFKKLESLCIKYLARYNYQSISVPKRTFSFKDYPTPEFDWIIWREEALLLTEHNSSFTHYTIDKIIRKFKKKELTGDPTEYLKLKIKESLT